VSKESLRHAYEATDFRVEDAPDGPFSLRVGEPSSTIDRLLTATGVNHWTYITACNPGSQLLSDAENARRMQELGGRVRELGFTTYHGKGVGTIGNWPPEPSLLVLGIDEPQAVALARQFGQAAILIGRLGEPARLLETG
jgi:hypothetical protein